MSAPETVSSARFAWRILKADPWTWASRSPSGWRSSPCPCPPGWPCHLGPASRRRRCPLPLLIAILAGFEIGRWVVLFPAIIQWHGSWVFWHTVPRVNALRSLVSDPGPATGRLPGSSGEAVSRFRDDARDVAQVLDVWLDLIAAGLTTVAGVIVLYLISPVAATAIVAPILLVLGIGHLLAARLRSWRWAEREATAGVTGFIGDAFGAIATVKVSAAEPAILERFARLGSTRAEAARADQVGTQLAQTLGGITANAGLGLALVLIAPAMSNGELSIGDIGLFTTYATAVSSLPRITARWSALQRQGDVSAARLGRLMPDHDPDQASADVTHLARSGPPAFETVTPCARRPDWHRPPRVAGGFAASRSTSTTPTSSAASTWTSREAVRRHHRPGRQRQVGPAAPCWDSCPAPTAPSGGTATRWRTRPRSSSHRGPPTSQVHAPVLRVAHRYGPAGAPPRRACGRARPGPPRR